jgi:uncharacterized protein (TIGR00299 family) protein
LTRIAILDPFSGIAGDMCLGALLDAGLEESFIAELPKTLGIEGVTVRIAKVKRKEIACYKVDFDVPPQPHGRHLKHIKAIVDASPAPDSVKAKAMECFTLITECEAAIHGTTVEKVHLHEVGSVDAILDIVGTIWGLEKLGVEHVYCGTIPLGDGFVETAHGKMAVPTAATLRLLEGLPVRPGPEGSGELVTPTGAALVRVLADRGPLPGFTPRGSGFGAGTKEFPDRANALRIVIADMKAKVATDGPRIVQSEVAPIGIAAVITADLDDSTGEELAAVADAARAAGALDVTLLATTMKKGRPGTRIEIVATPELAPSLVQLLLRETSTIGVRSYSVMRTILPRVSRTVRVDGHEIAVKVVTLPDGSTRAKPESDDVLRVSAATGRTQREIADAARAAAANVTDAARK